MASTEELDRLIESASNELKTSLSRLEGYTQLQSTLDTAGRNVQGAGESLAALAGQLGQATQSLLGAVSEFRGAIDAMREATPEALSHNVDQAVASVQRTEASAAKFQVTLKEEIAEQRESLERRVQAVESGLEQTRQHITQLRNSLEERFEALSRSTGRSASVVRMLSILTFLLVLAIAAVDLAPLARSLFQGSGLASG